MLISRLEPHVQHPLARGKKATDAAPTYGVVNVNGLRQRLFESFTICVGGVRIRGVRIGQLKALRADSRLVRRVRFR